MIITFEDLIASVSANRVFLAEIEPSVSIKNWVLQSGSIYRADIGQLDPKVLSENGVELEKRLSLAAITAGSWFYDGRRYVYIQPSTGTPYSKIYSLSIYAYFGSESKDFGNDRFYEPFLSTAPRVSQKSAELASGVSIISDGMLLLGNNKGELDEKFYNWDWLNHSVKLLMGGEDLPYSEYQSIFTGVIEKVEFRSSSIELQLIDAKAGWNNAPIITRFSKTQYPYLKDDDIGKPVPQVFGTVYGVRCVCTNEGQDASATNNFYFKFADTATYGIKSIVTVYVDDVAVSFTDRKTSGMFSLSTATYSPGQNVKADGIGFTASTIVIENPVEVLKAIASNSLGVVYANDWDTATTAVASRKAAEFVIGMAIVDEKSAIDHAGDLMRSCLGNFYTNNDGKYAISIWDTELPSNPDLVDEFDIEVGSIRIKREYELTRKTVRVGWRRDWSESGDNAFSIISQSDDETGYRYNINTELFVRTLLSTSLGAQTLLGRLAFIYANAVTLISFNTKMQLATKNVGDRVEVSWRRREADSYAAWITARAVEIQEIEKDYGAGITRLVVNDLKGVGGNIGNWTADELEFPALLGGSVVTAWESSWSTAQKSYAKQHWGFWTDDDGFADPLDAESYLISRWW